MMWNEFIKLAGYYVTYDDYHDIIEPLYMDSELSKKDFINDMSLKKFAFEKNKYIGNLTDKDLTDMEKRITAEYETAQKELTEKWNAYMERADKLLKGKNETLENAKASGDSKEIKKAEKELKNAKKDVLNTDLYYKEMVNETTNKLANVNEVSLSYINDMLSDVYAINYNAVDPEAYSLGIRYDIRNEYTIKRLIKDGDIKLPYKNLNVDKDKKWNARQLNSSVLQGILQGESMPQIAKRIKPIVNNNKNAAIRNARTMVTGAENRGKSDRFHELQNKGAIIRKVWMSTPDDRTRDWHLSMDGQEVDLDDYFVDGNGNELLYPGDPDAEPDTVYNCRCSMHSNITGFFDINKGLVKIEDSTEQEETLHESQIKDEKLRRITRPADAVVKGETQETKFGEDAYSQNRKDMALWAQSPKEADDRLRKYAEQAWKLSTEEEKDAAESYTAGSGGFNNPLRGFENGFKVGAENVSINSYQERNINALTRFISRVELEEDTWLQRGVGLEGAAGFLQVNEYMLKNASEDELKKALIGKVVSDDAFFSCGSSKGKGFAYSDVLFNVYCPNGTQAVYCEPFSAFGDGAGRDWDGIEKQYSFSGELETLLQRGGSYRVMKVEKGRNTIYIDIDLIDQNPQELNMRVIL